MKRATRWVWAVVLVVSAVLFGGVIPLLPQWGPGARHLDEPATIDLAGSTVTFPAGWDLNIEATVRGNPAAQGDGTAVRVIDGIWFGASDALVARVAELVGATDASLPQIPADAMGEAREEWQFEAPAGDDTPARRVDVVRWGQLVVVVLSNEGRGEFNAEAVDGIVASIDFGSIPLEAGGPTAALPRSGELIDAALERLR